MTHEHSRRASGKAKHSLTPREAIDAVGEQLMDGDAAAVIPHVEALEQAVRNLSTRESNDGFFEETVFNAPWLTPVSESLRLQHVELLAKVRDLRREVDAGDGSPLWRKNCQQLLEEFAEAYIEHDAGVQSLAEAQAWTELD